MIHDLESLYTKIHAENYPVVAAGNETVDTLLKHPECDGRRGLTLLITLDVANARKITALADEFKAIEPDQYYYPASDLHVTVLDVISAHEGFLRDDRQIERFNRLIEQAIAGIAPFELYFEGTMVSSIGILTKGFYREGLQDIRARVREVARAEGTEFRERYQSISAHVTLMRFTTAIKNRSRFLSAVDRCRNLKLGGMVVNGLSLVIHDWYNREKTEVGTFVVGG